MNIFLCNTDSDEGKSLVKKLSKEGKDRSIVQLTTKEMRLYNSNDFQILSLVGEGGQSIAEVTPGSSLLFTVNEDYNIDDIKSACRKLDVKFGIIRVKNSQE